MSDVAIRVDQLVKVYRRGGGNGSAGTAARAPSTD